MPITTFTQAANLVIPFGKYKGKTIDEVGVTDAGLLYLDWMRGERKSKAASFTDIDQALAIYLEDETIAADLDKMKQDREERA